MAREEANQRTTMVNQATGMSGLQMNVCGRRLTIDATKVFFNNIVEVHSLLLHGEILILNCGASSGIGLIIGLILILDCRSSGGLGLIMGLIIGLSMGLIMGDFY